MIKVLIATSDRSAGGIQRALADQASLLSDDASYEISALSPSSAFFDAVKDSSNNAFRLSDWQRFLFRYVPFLAPLSVKHNSFDIALCHNGFMARGLKKIAQKVIGICHNDKPSQFIHCDALVCLTQDGIEKAQAEGWDRNALHHIPHYHEIKHATPPKKPKAPIYVGAAGRMVEKKNLSLFIKIAALVKETHRDVTFLLGGDGKLMQTIQNQNQSLNSPVTILGWTDFDKFLKRLDIMVIPSLDEPFGYVYPEAMSQGVAILSSQSFGANHCLDKGAVSPIFGFDNPEPYAQDICRLADDLDALHARQLACFERAKDPVFHKSTAKTAWDELLQITAS